MMKEYHSKTQKMFQIMDNSGNIIKELKIKLSDKEILKAYKHMLFARAANVKAASIKKFNENCSISQNYGQEAITVTVGAIATPFDWIAPVFKEMGVFIGKGVSLKNIFLYYIDGESKCNFKESNKILPFFSSLPTKLYEATGNAYKIKQNKKDNVVFAFCKKGSTSGADYHEALNYAGFWNVPIIFIVQNNNLNQNRIDQNEETVLEKSDKYGIKGYQVDGNDFLAMYEILIEACEYTRKGNGPVVIEAFTHKMVYSRSDKLSRYLSSDSDWNDTDPLKRLKKYLISINLWSDMQENELIIEYSNHIDSELKEALAVSS